MCIFFNYLHYYHIFLKNLPVQPVTEGLKLPYCPTPKSHCTRVFWPIESAVLSPFRSIHQRHLKLGQCLDIDDRRSLIKFGDVTWPSLHFRHSISDVDIDDAAKIFQIIISRSYLSSLTSYLGIVWTLLAHNLQNR